MTRPIKITKQIHFQTAKRGRRVLKEGARRKPVPLGKVPRLSRLMAMALNMDDLLRKGMAKDLADLARLAMVTRGRMTQIMNLQLLAPEIQEEILFLPVTHGGRDVLSERKIRSIATVPDWRKQRVMWRDLLAGFPD